MDDFIVNNEMYVESIHHMEWNFSLHRMLFLFIINNEITHRFWGSVYSDEWVFMGNDTVPL
jgi:hypothetical protein